MYQTFDLTGLQVYCNKVWIFGRWNTQKQTLYEQKSSDYPRVDTTFT
jgi:hypothetical protein